LNVFEIDPRTLAPRGLGPLPDAFGYQKTLRTFALGRAAAGDTDGAVRILTSMLGRPREVEIFDRRAAGAILIASGRIADAERLLQNVPSFDGVTTLQAIFAMLAEPVPGIDLDSAAMEAFGISGGDVEVNRMLMQAYDAGGFADSAVRFALRVQQLAPNDPEASRVLRKRSPSAAGPGVTVPIPHD
jgi:hypothetical protein